MPTFYKPSQWRGKRQVYQSTDPGEPKQETAKVVRFLVLVLVAIVLGVLAPRLLFN